MGLGAMPQGLFPSDNLVVVVLGEAAVAVVFFTDAMFFQLAIRLFANCLAAVGTGCGKGLIVAVLRAAVVLGRRLAHCAAIVAEEALAGRVAMCQTERLDVNRRAALTANETGLFVRSESGSIGSGVNRGRFRLLLLPHNVHIPRYNTPEPYRNSSPHAQWHNPPVGLLLPGQ